MVSVVNLHYDVLVLIVDYLALPDLSALYRAVAGERNDTDIRTITTLRAMRAIYSLIIADPEILQPTIQIFPHPIMTPGQLHRISSSRDGERTHFFDYCPRIYRGSFKPGLERISSSKFKKILMGTRSVSYYPHIFEAEQVQLTSLRFIFYPRNPYIMDNQLLELRFEMGEHALSETVKDMPQTPSDIIYKVSQTLQLQSGVLIAPNLGETELPKY